MPQDTKYASVSYVFNSRGLIARSAQDQPPQYTYLNLDGALEREESAMSSTYGSVIINRDPDGTVGGVNYLLPNPIVSLSRLVNISNTFRYAADDQGFLYRRLGDTQGPYSQIASGLSGEPFASVVNTTFNSSMPYLFIADAVSMLKDNGSGAPTQIGINPPTHVSNIFPRGPNITEIDYFVDSLGSYTTSSVTSWASTAIGTVVSDGTAEVIENFVWFEIASGISNAFNGVFASVSGNAGTAPYAQLFGVYGQPLVSQLSGFGINGNLSPTGVTTFSLNSYGGSVAASTTATVSRTVNLDLSQNNQVQDADLIVLTVKVSQPNNVQQINVQFDLNGSGYKNYFTKSISPQLYQSGITGASDPYTALSDQVYAKNLQQGTSVLGSGSGLKVLVRDIPEDGGPGGGDDSGSQLNPSNLSTGPDAWITVYIPRGDFLPVGLAGQYNQTWANITGWRIQIVTNANSGGTSFSFNALYLQWGAGPSSFGGIGYDYRYTYYNVNTGTESNPSQIMYASEKYGTPANLAPLIVLRQGIGVFGYYSADPQVTHIRIYRRGGNLGDNWRYVDQLPNVLNTTGALLFNYTDIIPDSDLSQSDLLVLDNDVPVTSSLPVPISTTLVADAGGQYQTPPLGNPVSVYGNTYPGYVAVTDSSAVFVANQIVVVGTPQNLEQSYVITGGAGFFWATLRLLHAAGEQVQVFSIPGQPVDLVELAYGQMWWAGDPNNPHYLYYSKPGLPENCGPQNYIQVSEPSDPIMAIINFRGTLYAATYSTWYLIVGGGGQVPYAQATGSKHGLVAKHGYCQTESAIWYQCLPEDESEILTRSGWKTREQLTISEDVLAYDMESGTCKWTPLQAINSFEYEGGLVHLTGGREETRLDFSCTYDHNWVWDPEKRRKPYDENRIAHWEKYRWCYDVCACGSPKAKKAKRCKKCSRGRDQQLKRAQQLSAAGNIIQAAPIEEGDSLLTPREAAILGWIVTDGSITRNNGKKDGRRTARIHQAETSKHIVEIATLLGYDGSCVYKREIVNGYAAKYGKTVVECDFALTTDATERLFHKAGFNSKNDLPRIVCALNLESAKAMLDAMINADGSRGKAIQFGQNKGPIMDAFRILAFMCGHPTNAPSYSQPEGYRTEHGKTCVIKNPRLDCQGIRKTTRWYKGRVWCPTTQYGTWVARSNDTISITGNSIDGIREFRGADGAYRSLIIEWIFRNNDLTPVPLANLNSLGSTTMGYWNNYVYVSYVKKQS